MTSKTPSKGYVEAWEVESRTEPGTAYTVSKRADGTYACSCPRWKFHQKPKVNCKHILAVAINAPRPGAYSCSLCGFNTDEWVQMLMHRGTCPKRAPSSDDIIGTAQRRAYLDAAATSDRYVTRNQPAAPKSEPDGLERFTVRRKFKLTE